MVEGSRPRLHVAQKGRLFISKTQLWSWMGFAPAGRFELHSALDPSPPCRTIPQTLRQVQAKVPCRQRLHSDTNSAQFPHRGVVAPGGQISMSRGHFASVRKQRLQSPCPSFFMFVVGPRPPGGPGGEFGRPCSFEHRGLLVGSGPGFRCGFVQSCTHRLVDTAKQPRVRRVTYFCCSINSFLVEAFRLNGESQIGLHGRQPPRLPCDVGPHTP